MLIGLFAVLLVVVPVVLALLLLGARTGEDDVAADAPTGPVATTAPPAPTPTSAPSSDDDAGFLDGLLEDLLGGTDPATMAACVGMPGGAPTPLPEEVPAAIEAIAEQVAQERGLELVEPIEPALLSPEEMRDRVVELTTDDYPAQVADADSRLLSTLGAIPDGTDLQQLQLDLLGGQVAGFYDPDTGELTAVASDGLDPATRITLAHEIDHALTDQTIGLPDLDGFDGRSDAGLAALAVIEGDATLLMQRWAMQHLTLREQLAAAATSLGPAGQLQSTPWVLQQQLVFPYVAGLDFACGQFLEGGWPAIDELYAAPPTTSAQVLWPERFAAGETAIDVADPVLPEGWDEVRRDQWGAADLLWLFQAPGDDRSAALSDPETRAQAWAGGEVALGTNGEDSVLALTLAAHADATLPLCASVTDWYARAFPAAVRDRSASGATTFTGTEQSAVVACDGDVVDLGIAPELSLAADIVGAAP